jgi:hypothetical protein
MKSFIGARHVLSAAEFVELALGLDDDLSPPLAGIDLDLFRGPLTGETAAERAARLDVAAEVLADLREQGDGDEIAALDAAYATALLRTTPLRPRATVRHRTRRAVAA